MRSSKNVAGGKVIKFMSKRTKSRQSRFLFRLTVLVCTFATVAGAGFGWAHWHNHGSLHDRYITQGVQRADLFPIRLASGRVESGKRTVIECQLENIAVGVTGTKADGVRGIGLAQRDSRGVSRQARRCTGGTRFLRLRRAVAIAANHTRTRQGR